MIDRKKRILIITFYINTRPDLVRLEYITNYCSCAALDPIWSGPTNFFFPILTSLMDGRWETLFFINVKMTRVTAVNPYHIGTHRIVICLTMFTRMVRKYLYQLIDSG